MIKIIQSLTLAQVEQLAESLKMAPEITITRLELSQDSGSLIVDSVHDDRTYRDAIGRDGTWYALGSKPNDV